MAASNEQLAVSERIGTLFERTEYECETGIMPVTHHLGKRVMAGAMGSDGYDGSHCDYIFVVAEEDEGAISITKSYVGAGQQKSIAMRLSLASDGSTSLSELKDGVEQEEEELEPEVFDSQVEYHSPHGQFFQRNRMLGLYGSASESAQPNDPISKVLHKHEVSIDQVSSWLAHPLAKLSVQEYMRKTESRQKELAILQAQMDKLKQKIEEAKTDE